MSKFWGQEEDQTSLFQHERQLSYLNSNMVQEIISTAETVTSVNAKYKHKKMQKLICWVPTQDNERELHYVKEGSLSLL